MKQCFARAKSGFLSQLADLLLHTLQNLKPFETLGQWASKKHQPAKTNNQTTMLSFFSSQSKHPQPLVTPHLTAEAKLETSSDVLWFGAGDDISSDGELIRSLL